MADETRPWWIATCGYGRPLRKGDPAAPLRHHKFSRDHNGEKYNSMRQGRVRRHESPAPKYARREIGAPASTLWKTEEGPALRVCPVITKSASEDHERVLRRCDKTTLTFDFHSKCSIIGLLSSNWTQNGISKSIFRTTGPKLLSVRPRGTGKSHWLPPPTP